MPELLPRSGLNTTSSKEYTYRPIRSTHVVRVMILLPSRLGLRLRCLLQSVAVDRLTNYEAISYTWGDESSTTSILCGADEGEIQITENLELALLHFRQDDKPRILWADMICIDQKNIEERNNQVCLMGKIFSRAWRVLIWVGPEDQHTGLAFEYLDMLQKRVVEHSIKPPVNTFQNKEEARA
jgi:hypothetical protein